MRKSKIHPNLASVTLKSPMRLKRTLLSLEIKINVMYFVLFLLLSLGLNFILQFFYKKNSLVKQ